MAYRVGATWMAGIRLSVGGSTGGRTESQPVARGPADVDDALVLQRFSEWRPVGNGQHVLVGRWDSRGIQPEAELVHLGDLAPVLLLLRGRGEVDIPELEARTAALGAGGNVLEHLHAQAANDHQPRIIERVDSLNEKFDTFRRGVFVGTGGAGERFDDANLGRQDQFEHSLGFGIGHDRRRGSAAGADDRHGEHHHPAQLVTAMWHHDCASPQPEPPGARHVKRRSLAVRGERRQPFAGDSRPARRGAILVLAIISTAPLVGCAPKRIAPQASAPRYPLIMTYDFGAAATSSAGTVLPTTLHEDARRIRELGFDAVHFRRAYADAAAARDIAIAHDLTPVMNDLRADRWLAGIDAAAGKNRSARDVAEGLMSDAANEIVALEPRRSPARQSRCRALVDELCSRGIAFVEIGTPGLPADTPTAALVRWTNSSRQPVESWLGQYHEGLSLGQTGGLVFREYHRPGDDASILDPSDSIETRARLAALRELVGRAATWGPRIARLNARPVSCRQAPADVVVTALVDQQYRYLLIRNRAADRFARGEVVLPATFEGVTIRRAVEVATSASAAPGQVVEGTSGELRVAVDMRPGEARLFELLPTSMPE